MKVKGLLKIIGASESPGIEWKPSLSQINEIIATILPEEGLVGLLIMFLSDAVQRVLSFHN